MRFSKTALRLSMGVLSAVFMFSAAPANAGLLLDPYLGYEMGTMKATLAGGGSSESDNSGVALGARVGYTLPIFWFGVDYSMVNGGKLKGKSNATDNDYDRSTLYLMAGASLPLIRGWIGYGLLNDIKAKSTGSEATYSGPAIKLGAGFTGLPFVSLNLEYIMTDFKKVKANGVEQDIGGPTFSDAKNNTVMLSVSLPFDL